MLAFFSSDAMPLYKKDIFRQLSVPDGFVVHFRYDHKWIDISLDAIKSNIGKPCMVFHTVGNDLNKEPKDRVITNIAIREVTMIDFEDKSDTGLMHFYLKVGGFKKCDVTFPKDNTPPYKFVSDIKIEKIEQILWREKIAEINNSFKGQLFFKFDIFETKNNATTPIPPQFNKNEKQSFFLLNDESAYILDMAFYDTLAEDSGSYLNMQIVEKDGKIKINAPETINIDARSDNRRFNIYTNSLDTKQAFTYVSFVTNINLPNQGKQVGVPGISAQYAHHSSIANPSIAALKNVDTIIEVNDVTVQIHIDKNTKRSFQFAFYTSLAVISIALGKAISDCIKLEGSFNCFSYLLIFGGLITLGLGGFSAFKLYELFNKK